MSELPSNENAHQLRALVPAPTQTYASLAASPEGVARAAPRARSARRLHARVRLQPARCSTSKEQVDQLFQAQALRRGSVIGIEANCRQAVTD